jgi:hypothetical protein
MRLEPAYDVVDTGLTDSNCRTVKHLHVGHHLAHAWDHVHYGADWAEL